MTQQQFDQLAQALERYGLPTLFALALLFLLYLLIRAVSERLRNDGQNDLEDTKIQFKNADNMGVLAKVIEGNTTTMLGLGQTINASVAAYEKIYGIQDASHQLIVNISQAEHHVKDHMTSVAEPFKAIHEKTHAELAVLKKMVQDVLDRIQDVQTSIDDTGEHPQVILEIPLSLDEKKESIQ